MGFLKNKRFLFFGVLAFGVLSLFVWKSGFFAEVGVNQETPKIPVEERGVLQTEGEPAPLETRESEQREFSAPLASPEKRITKKPFGILIDPKTSPVQPERFSGYHVGTDFEILPGEEDVAVMIQAVCDGPIQEARTASGYGGLVRQECLRGNKNVQILYGHLDSKKVKVKVGQKVKQGEFIGELGKGYSKETDGERKHLHLGVYQGEGVSIRGYEASKSNLSNWLDVCSLGMCE
jgi:murein DD-endopeptidase MepM/ murein hydrolase activator NlpD